MTKKKEKPTVKCPHCHKELFFLIRYDKVEQKSKFFREGDSMHIAYIDSDEDSADYECPECAETLLSDTASENALLFLNGERGSDHDKILKLGVDVTNTELNLTPDAAMDLVTKALNDAQIPCYVYWREEEDEEVKNGDDE